ncbi:MAG: APC family permease [Promethearchaeota archaeon]
MAEDKELKRGLNLPMAIFIIIGMVIGSSIWISPAAWLSRTGPAIFISYLIAVIPAIFVAYIAAYIGAALPVAGGTYMINSRLFKSSFLGFLSVWLVILAVSAALAFLSATFAVFLSEILLIAEESKMAFVIGVGVIVLVAFYILNFFKVEITGLVEMIITIFGDILVMLIFIFAAIPAFKVKNFQPLMPLGFSPVLFAALTFYFSYTGFTLIIDVAGEVKKPQRNIPLALLISIPLLTILYTLQALMVAGLQPYDQPVGTVTEIILTGGLLPQGTIIFITILIAIAIASTLHPLYLAFSRDLLMAGRDQLFPAKLAKVHERFKTPIPALTVLFIFGLAFLLTFIPIFGPIYGIETAAVLLSAITGVTVLILQIPICFGAVKFKQNYPELHEKSRFKPSEKKIKIMGWAGGISSLVFVLLLFTDPDAGTIVSLILFPFAGVGVILYFIRKLMLKKRGIEIATIVKTFPEQVSFEEEIPPKSKIERLADEKEQ